MGFYLLFVTYIVGARVAADLIVSLIPINGGVIGHESFKIHCSETNATSVVQSISLAKWDGQIYGDIANINQNDQVSWLDSDIEARANVRGATINSVFIELDFNDLKCSDSGLYQCQTSSQDGMEDVTHDVSVWSTPDEIKLTSSPPLNEVQYGSAVTLTCAGNVGSPPGTMYWYLRPVNSEFYEPYNTNFTITDPEQGETPCLFTRSSSVIYYHEKEATIYCNISNSVSTEPIGAHLSIAVGRSDSILSQSYTRNLSVLMMALLNVVVS